MRFPKDSSARAIGTRARSIVPYRLNSEVFDWQELTGTDHGTDMVIEYVEEGSFRNYKMECQIKGTTKLNILKNGDLSFALDIKTIAYALGCPRSFLLLLVDVICEEVYCLPLQQYFIENKELFKKIESNSSTLSVHIPENNILDDECSILKMYAKKTYVDGPTEKIREYK